MAREETDAVLLALRTEPRAMSQGMQAAPEKWKRPGNRFSPHASRNNAAQQTDFRF